MSQQPPNSVRSMDEISELFTKENTMTSPAQNPTPQSAGITVEQMEAQLDALLKRTMDGLASSVAESLAPISESVQNLSSEFEQIKPSIDALQGAAEKVQTFDGRVEQMEAQTKATASKLDDFLKKAEGPKEPVTAEDYFKKYGMIAGQAAIMVATLGAIVYNNRGTRVVNAPTA